MTTDENDALVATLAEARGRFLAFVRTRVSDPELAEDILQDALLRAARSVDTLRDEDRLVPWFYQLLRNAIVDAYRRRATQQHHLVPIESSLEERIADVPDPATAHALCACFLELVPTLKPEYRAVLEAVDLGPESPAAAARRLGITSNNLKVRRHRARVALRERIEQTCRTCAAHGCLDCTCESAPVDTAMSHPGEV